MSFLCFHRRDTGSLTGAPFGLTRSLDIPEIPVRQESGDFLRRSGYVCIRDLMDVLVVEDEKKMAEALQEGLEADHYSVQISYSGEEGFYLVQARAFDLMILDIMLPGHDGLEILTTLRRRGIKTPVLLLTARDSIEDRVRGLDSGADDYLVKPFAFAELQARARALLRRGRPDVDRRFKLMDLELDGARRSVARGGHSIELTTREFDLLEYLVHARRPGCVAGDAGAGHLERNEPAYASRQRH